MKNRIATLLMIPMAAVLVVLTACEGVSPTGGGDKKPPVVDPPETLAGKLVSVHNVFPLEEAMAACGDVRLIEFVVTNEDGSAEVALITGEFTVPDDGGEGWTWTYVDHGDGATGTLSVIAADGSIVRYAMAFDGLRRHLRSKRHGCERSAGLLVRGSVHDLRSAAVLHVGVAAYRPAGGR